MSDPKRRSAHSTRAALRSPGRPPVGRREDRQRFWAAIARGCYPEAAVVDARVSWVVGARWFRQAGGMPPTHLAPSAPSLSGRYLSFAEREQLALLRAQDHGVREIASQLGRAPSTISRELRRNAATRSGAFEYRASTAQWHADRAARRPKTATLATHRRLRQYVQERLAGVIAAPGGALVRGPTVPWKGRRHGPRQHRRWGRAWSPEQIARRLPLDFPDDPTMRVSHETIYQALYIQGRGALRQGLTVCLRTGRALRVPRARTRATGKRFVTPELMISERPAEADDRAVRGIGREISSLDWAARPSAPSLSARHASRSSSTCHAWRRTRPVSARLTRRTGRRWLATARRRCATRSPARSGVCRRSCGAR